MTTNKMNSFIERLKQQFTTGSTLTKLLYVNAGVFVLVTLITIVFTLFSVDVSPWLDYVEMPASWSNLWHQPWALVTYMFLHADFFHIFFNMLCLYWFGKQFLNYYSQKQLVGLYIWGGISGALLYFLAYNIFPYFAEHIDHSFLLGASASIMAIIVAVAMAAPNFRIQFLFIGEIKMKYFAGITVLISVLSITGSNAGGEFAHLGGALFGYMYAVLWQKGTDLSQPINKIIDWFVNLFGSKKKIRVSKTHFKDRPKTDADYNQNKKKNEAELDAILDKIKRSGYQSLTNDERQYLFNQSQSLH